MTAPTLPEINPTITDATRREFLALLAAAGLLTGCSDDTPPEAPAAGTRTVEHLGGTTDIPVAPQRVAVLDESFSIHLIHLGLPPAGAGDELDSYLTDLATAVPVVDRAAIATVMTASDPNLEALATLRPDLILGTERNAESYEQLSAIAPTVLVERGANGNWRPRFRGVADVVGRTEQADEIERAYEDALAALPAAVTDTTVAFVRPEADGQFRVDSTPLGFAGSVATDVGIPILAPPAGVGEGDPSIGTFVSDERLDIIATADLIVVPDYRSLGDETDSLTQFAANPLWSTLPAVAAGRVVQVPGLVYNGGNHYSAQLLLQAIAEAVAATP